MLAGLTFTVLYTVATTILITLVAIPLAVVLNRKFFARNFVRSVFFFPAIPSLAILGLVWGYILSPLASGALNSLLESVFSIGPFPWLSDDTLGAGVGDRRGPVVLGRLARRHLPGLPAVDPGRLLRGRPRWTAQPLGSSSSTSPCRC